MMRFLSVFAVLYSLGMVWMLVSVRKDIGTWRIAFVTVFWWMFIGEGR
jgi:hypothetical protein